MWRCHAGLHCNLDHMGTSWMRPKRMANSHLPCSAAQRVERVACDGDASTHPLSASYHCRLVHLPFLSALQNSLLPKIAICSFVYSVCSLWCTFATVMVAMAAPFFSNALLLLSRIALFSSACSYTALCYAWAATRNGIVQWGGSLMQLSSSPKVCSPCRPSMRFQSLFCKSSPFSLSLSSLQGFGNLAFFLYYGALAEFMPLCYCYICYQYFAACLISFARCTAWSFVLPYGFTGASLLFLPWILLALCSVWR